MSYLTQPDYIKYVCTCGQLKPITSLYFCRHCLKIRCGFCICHEVDSHYCANCLENMPSSEARLKKNRCSSCFDCPSCFHTLSTRATLGQPRQSQDAANAGPGGDTKVENKQPKKMYYLSCFNCRWTSRDVGIPDQPVASGGWPERTNPFTPRVNQLLDYYKTIAQQEKQEKLEKERKKFAIRGKYITLTDKTGLTSAMARNIAGLPSLDPSQSHMNFTPSVASADVEELPDDHYTKEVNLKQVTALCVRLGSPAWQPDSASRLQPAPRLLAVKRSQRCRRCDHNLTKPEYNPGSVKFKIELLAYYHVPEVKIISYEPIKAGQTSELLIKLTNPTGHEMQISIISPEDLPKVDEEEPKSIEKSLEKSLNLEKEPSSLASLARPAPASANCSVSPLSAAVSVPQRDDAAEYDDDDKPLENPIIVWRKSNKVALRLQVSASPCIQAGDSATAVLALQYSYRNTIPPNAGQTKPLDHTCTTTLYADLGKVV